jgi:hypothetical protein
VIAVAYGAITVAIVVPVATSMIFSRGRTCSARRDGLSDDHWAIGDGSPVER